jgi:hypothetical protein
VTLEDVLAAVDSGAAPPGLPPLVRALVLEARGDWSAAHQIAQDDHSPGGAWVHAYLHRKEGDAQNAAYWYRRAAKPVAKGALDEEWRSIAAALVSI